MVLLRVQTWLYGSNKRTRTPVFRSISIISLFLSTLLGLQPDIAAELQSVMCCQGQLSSSASAHVPTLATLREPWLGTRDPVGPFVSFFPPAPRQLTRQPPLCVAHQRQAATLRIATSDVPEVLRWLFARFLTFASFTAPDSALILRSAV